jgi:hypothetical protein
MNILHAAEIHRRFRGVHGVSFHPGVVSTGFAREGALVTRVLYESWLKRIFMITPEKGADTLVWLATTRPGRDWTVGEYFVRRKPSGKSRQASDPDLARQLWNFSQAAAGENR